MYRGQHHSVSSKITIQAPHLRFSPFLFLFVSLLDFERRKTPSQFKVRAVLAQLPIKLTLIVFPTARQC